MIQNFRGTSRCKLFCTEWVSDSRVLQCSVGAENVRRLCVHPRSLCNALGPGTSVDRLYFSKKQQKVLEGLQGGDLSPRHSSARVPGCLLAVSVLSGSCTYVCLNSCAHTCIQYIRIGIDGCTFKYMRARVCVCYFPFLCRGWQA